MQALGGSLFPEGVLRLAPRSAPRLRAHQRVLDPRPLARGRGRGARRARRRDARRPRARPTPRRLITRIDTAPAQDRPPVSDPERHRRADRARVRGRLHDRRRVRHGAAGARRGRDRLHLEQEGRAAVAARLAPARVPRAGARCARRTRAGRRSRSRRSTTRRSATTRRRSRQEAGQHGRGRSGDPRAPSRSSASRSSEQKMLAGVAVDAVFDSRLGCDHLQGEARRARHRVLLVLRRGEDAPGAGAKYLGSVVPYSDNFFATLNSAVFTDGSFVYVPPGRALPDGALDVLPDQRGEDRPVRAHADRRRRGRLRVVPRGLHRADARREPAARGGGRAGRARRRHDQVLDGPELVPGRQARAAAASTTS